jgi:hypothetical protein
MAEKLDKNDQKIPFAIEDNVEKDMIYNELTELERTLAEMKIIEDQAKEMILKIKSYQKNT